MYLFYSCFYLRLIQIMELFSCNMQKYNLKWSFKDLVDCRHHCECLTAGVEVVLRVLLRGVKSSSWITVIIPSPSQSYLTILIVSVSTLDMKLVPPRGGGGVTPVVDAFTSACWDGILGCRSCGEINAFMIAQYKQLILLEM